MRYNMKEDILNKSVSDIRLRSLQKCINKTDSLIFNRDNSIVHIKKTNSTNPFNNTNLGVNFSCNKYGNLETYVDNSGTSVAVSANDIKGSNKEIKKACNNIYDEIFVDKRMHTNDRRGVRFGSVDCVNINSNNIYSNTRKNVTFNTKIYDDQDYFYNMIHPTTRNQTVTSVFKNKQYLPINKQSNCFFFSDKDSVTDYAFNKNRDHFFVGTEINVNNSIIPTRCFPYKLNYEREQSMGINSIYIYEKNKLLRFNYSQTETYINPNDNHKCSGVYCNIFNASTLDSIYEEDNGHDYCCNLNENNSGSRWNSGGSMSNRVDKSQLTRYPFKNIQTKNIADKSWYKVHTFGDRRSQGSVSSGALTEWQWHFEHQAILNKDLMKIGDSNISFQHINMIQFILKYVTCAYNVSQTTIKRFYGVDTNKKINNLIENAEYFKNSERAKFSVLAGESTFNETKHSSCGEIREDMENTSYSYGQSYYDGTWTEYRSTSYTNDTYTLLFPFGFILTAGSDKTSILNFMDDQLSSCIDKFGLSKLKKLNTIQFLNIDDENIDVEFNDTISVQTHTIDGDYNFDSSIRVI